MGAYNLRFYLPAGRQACLPAGRDLRF